MSIKPIVLATLLSISVATSASAGSPPPPNDNAVGVIIMLVLGFFLGETIFTVPLPKPATN